MVLTETKKKKKKQRICQIEDNKTPVIDFLGHNLEQYGPTTQEDNSTEMIMGNHAYKYIYFPNKIGNLPEDPRSDWDLGDHYAHPNNWKMEEVVEFDSFL